MHHLRTNVHEVQKRTSARAANDLVLASVRDVEADAVESIRIPQQRQEGGTLIFSYPQEKTLTIEHWRHLPSLFSPRQSIGIHDRNDQSPGGVPIRPPARRQLVALETADHPGRGAVAGWWGCDGDHPWRDRSLNRSTFRAWVPLHA
jgi:hypothetical protein